MATDRALINVFANRRPSDVAMVAPFGDDQRLARSLISFADVIHNYLVIGRCLLAKGGSKMADYVFKML